MKGMEGQRLVKKYIFFFSSYFFLFLFFLSYTRLFLVSFLRYANVFKICTI